MTTTNKEVQVAKPKTVKAGTTRDRKAWKEAVEKLALAASVDQFVRSLAGVFSEVRKRIAYIDKTDGSLKWKQHGGRVTRLELPLAPVKGLMRVECSEELPISEQMAKTLGQFAQELMTSDTDTVFVVRYEGDSFDVITVSIGQDEWMRKVVRFSKATSWET